jgi:hypothetical protein
MGVGAPTILAVQAGIALVSSAVQPALLAPNLSLHGGFAMALGATQVLVALSFITGIGDWLGGLGLLGLVGLTALLFSPADALEQSFWGGIAIAMVVVGRGSHVGVFPRPWSPRFNARWTGSAIAALRIATGASLIVVALTEKLWNPALAQAFLVDRPYLNVFQTLPGMGWFNNDAFALAAGLTEAAIGAMLISGFATRLVIIGMWLPFNLGIPVLPSQELLGHLPILGVMYVLLVQETRPTVVHKPSQPRRVPAAAGAQLSPSKDLVATE